MPALSINVPFPVFQDRDGQPLDNGYVYIGTPYLDPQTNPVQVYFDDALTIPAAQPLRTINGYVSNAGTPAQLYVNGVNFSIKVLDSKANLVYSFQDGSGISPNAAGVQYDPAGAGAVSTTVQAKLRETVSVKDFGAVGDGVADDTAAIVSENAVLLANSGGDIYAHGETLKITSPILLAGEMSKGATVDYNNATISFASGAGFTAGSYTTPAAEFRLKTVIRGLNSTGPGKAVVGTTAFKVDSTAEVSTFGGRWRSAEKGLWLNGGLICDFYMPVIRDNGTGVVANPANGFASNSINFITAKIITNDLAVNYDSNANGVTNWVGCEIENNNSTGNATDGKVVTSLTAAGHHNFIGCHFESNKGQTSLRYSGASTAKSLLIAGSEMIDSSAGTGVDVTQGRATVIATRIMGATNGINFGANARGTLIDAEANPSGTLGNVVCLRDGRLSFGANPVASEPLIAATSTAMTAASNIATSFQSNVVQHRALNAAGTRVGYIQFNNSAAHYLLNDQAQGWEVYGNGSVKFYIGRAGATSVEPGADNTHTLGSAILRWSTVYAGTGTINTSDERTKQDIGDLNDAEKRVALTLKTLIKKFRFKDAVAEKGDKARIHVGVIAQDVKAAFEDEGLVAEDYAILCHDTWPDRFDEKGALVQAAGDRYGVRYEQLLAFVIAAL